MPLPSSRPHLRRPHERGGMLILVALMLLMVATLAAFSLSHTTLKELATTGNVYQAGRSETAADAGLDWFVAWTGQAATGGEVQAGTKQATVTSAVTGMLEQPQRDALKREWKSDTSDATDPFLLQGLSKDKAITQAFDLRLEFLGHPAGDAAGNKNVGKFSVRENAWELQSTGQALVKTGSGKDDYLRYRAVRAAKLDIR